MDLHEEKTSQYTLEDFAAISRVYLPKKTSSINNIMCKELELPDETLWDKTFSYFFTIDYSSYRYGLISKSIKNVLGYTHSFFMEAGIRFGFYIIHPEDRIKLKSIHRQMFAYYYHIPVHLRKELKFSYNMRVTRADSSIIHILMETLFLEINEDGFPLLQFTTCIDISQFKKDNKVKLTIYQKDKDFYKEVFDYEIPEHDELLTKRQIEILNLVSHGFTTNQIASKLFLSIETVKNHRKNILARTGARNCTEALQIALRA